MASKRKAAKFKVGQVVYCSGCYFKIKRHVWRGRGYYYNSTYRVSPWDNGHWYYQDDEKRSAYSEYSLRPLTKREKGRK